MPLLRVEGAVAGYGEMQVLRGVDLTVEEGEIVSIVGPNGAGKSTVMKLIFGLLKPWEGSVTFAGRDVSGMAPERLVRLGLSYVPQVDNVFPNLTVEENLDMGGYIRSGSLAEQKERVYELFPRLAERRKQRAGKMSGGERQMVAMGRALMLDPRLLMLDEPSAGLAPLLVDMIFDKIVEVNGTGVAVLMVEQNAKKSLALAHRGYVLATGQNQVDGPGRDLLENPEVARLYLGG
ncbi:MAG: ABC transporter ATP-binding protein [Trueperaceae bacterium]|nr:ABC transporter ATP-binding protein [Trueperaceae bacterium]MCC6309912.1 ABC transporter ATP-binding protein [Trueperaceae bacterium]MCO5172973.1 ABC transporter ATP-binding protein [Trueperaceae bacterium]MCW5819726.1 ABC transporter ATP-binding protein [Trueperaceae bacterium]